MKPLCPLCNTELRIEPNEFFEQYPTYVCPINYVPIDGPSYRKTHYVKYFTADWSYTRYEEHAYLGKYRVVNYHNYREGKTDFCAIQEYKQKYHDRRPSVSMTKFHNMVTFQHCLKLAPEAVLLNKVKTILLFS